VVDKRGMVQKACRGEGLGDKKSIGDGDNEEHNGERDLDKCVIHLMWERCCIQRYIYIGSEGANYIVWKKEKNPLSYLWNFGDDIIMVKLLLSSLNFIWSSFFVSELWKVRFSFRNFEKVCFYTWISSFKKKVQGRNSCVKTNFFKV
jgi:hypothetical protein